MNIEQFCRQYPGFCFDFAQPISAQPRILDPGILSGLPAELEAGHTYRSGGRGRPNLNQTRTHKQCGTCRRVLRNDHFYSPPSLQEGNVLHTHCKACAQRHNEERYAVNADRYRTRRNAIWRYLAPCCVCCGFDTHVSAMDMHHMGPKEGLISELVTELAFSPSPYKVEKLLREARHCIPVCSNCHRMLHAGVLELPDALETPKYRLEDLISLVEDPA